MDDDQIDSTVNQLLSQLNTTQQISKKIEATDDVVQKENLEQFLLQYSGRLIKGSVDFVDELKQFVSSAPTAEDVEALAKLVASSAAAIESLNKILISNKDGETKVKLKNMDTDTKVRIKTMDIDSKKKLQEIDMQGKLLMNREELLAKLITDAKLIEAETTTVTPAQTSN